MASYRKRGDNWEYRITYYDPITNKRREKTKKGFRTKKEAMVAAAQAEINIDQDFLKRMIILDWPLTLINGLKIISPPSKKALGKQDMIV